MSKTGAILLSVKAYPLHTGIARKKGTDLFSVHVPPARYHKGELDTAPGDGKSGAINPSPRTSVIISFRDQETCNTLK